MNDAGVITDAAALTAAQAIPPAPVIPLAGVLCHGRLVELGWPEEHEFDALTALRNRPPVRARFLDPRPLDIAANREWLRCGMRRPDEALLAIRQRTTGALCGMIGWSRWDRETGTLDLGRAVVDVHAVRGHFAAAWHPHPGIGLDAGTTLRDYAFERMRVSVLRTVYIGDNAHSARLNRLAGGRISGRTREVRRDGSEVELVHAEMTREEWQHLREVANR